MKTINVEGVQLNEAALETLREWQESDDWFLNMKLESLDNVIYHLAVPEMGDLDDKGRLGLISDLALIKRQLANFKREEEHEQKRNEN